MHPCAHAYAPHWGFLQLSCEPAQHALPGTSPKGCVHGEDVLGASEGFIQDIWPCCSSSWTRLDPPSLLSTPTKPAEINVFLQAQNLKSPCGAEDPQQMY